MSAFNQLCYEPRSTCVAVNMSNIHTKPYTVFCNFHLSLPDMIPLVVENAALYIQEYTTYPLAALIKYS